MSTIKISQLPVVSAISSNTSNTLFVGVDVPSLTTFQMTAHVLAQGLYSNEVLNVGNNPNTLPNTTAQFAASGESYIQTNLVNTNDGGSADIVVTANAGSGGTDSAYFIDMGFVNKNYQPGSEFNNIGTAVSPLDGYLYVQGLNSSSNGGNLIVGSTSSNGQLKFIVGGGTSANIVARMTSNSLTLNTQSRLIFGDGTIQTTASASNAYSQAAFTQANAAFVQANTANTLAQAGFNKANSAVQNTAVIQLQSLTLTGNLVANSSGQSASIDNITSNTATFNKNVIVLGNLTANGLLGNIFFSNVVTVTTQSNSILWLAQANPVTQQTGQLWYSSNTQSLVLDTDIPGDRPSISKVLFFRAYNNTGAAIPSNSFVRLTGSITSNLIPSIALADATSAANATVAGFVSNGINNGGYGFVYSAGLVENFNASGLGSGGDVLYLSASPGQSSNVAPTGSNTVVQVARVLSNDPTFGKISVQIQLRQAYGRTNGSVLYAYANNIVSSNTISVNDAIGTVNANTIIANTIVYGSATANAMVTQLTSKSTAVTANGMSGQITMNNAALAGQGYVTFTVNNSSVLHVSDIPFVAIQNSVTTPNPYQVCVGKVAVGSFNISVYNSDSGGGSSHSDAIVLNWGLLRVGN
jgi:hypothetical protein